jgi:hypothetical protein
MKNLSLVQVFLVAQIFLAVYFAVCWIVNFIQFISLDFEPSYRDELVKGFGVFTGLGSGITVWM